MIPNNVRQAIEDMIDDCAQTDYENFQQIDLGCVEQWLKAESEPLAADRLAQEGWIMDSFANEAYMPLDDEREIRVDCNSGAVTHKGIAFPGVRTMRHLRALIEMLQG